MNPRERHLAVQHGQEPDRVNVIAAEGLRAGPQGGWMRRMQARGMGVTHIVPAYKPFFFYDHWVNPELPEVIYQQTHFIEQGVHYVRHGFETPAGSIHSVVGRNPDDDVLTGSVQEYFVKEPEDWPVVNDLFRRMLDAMRPNDSEVQRDLDDLGPAGYTIALLPKTPFQLAWIELATMDRAAIDARLGAEGFLEYVEVQRAIHTRAAELAAGVPTDHLAIIENLTNILSPAYYRQYCQPYYEIYARAFAGTSKVLAVHCDGLLGHLMDEIAASPFQIVDSFTVPPTGNVTLSAAKAAWPDKIPFVNLPPHLAFAEEQALHAGYQQILDEWGSRVLTLEHVEDLPEGQLEKHLSAALDVCGY